MPKQKVRKITKNKSGVARPAGVARPN